MRYRILLTITLFAVMAIHANAANLLPSPPPGLEGDRGQVGKVLLESKDENLLCSMIQVKEDNDDIRYLKMLAAKRLSIYGTEKSVPVLVPMLAEVPMGMYARYALEPMPNKAVDEALREQTKTLKGQALVGVLTTIGVRRDAEAVPLLSPLLTNEDPEVVRTTYAAYGYIGTPECGEVLKTALGNFKPAFEKAICDAAMNCAEHLLQAGASDQALSLYDAVLQSQARAFLKEGAIYGRITAQKSDGVNDLVKYLHSDETGLFEAALQVVRLLPPGGTPDVCDTLIAELEKLPPAKRALLLEALAGRKDALSRAKVLPLALAVKEPEVVRVSAMRALGTLDTPEAVPGLLLGLKDNDGTGPVSEAAFRALSFMENKDADEAIAKAMIASGKTLDVTFIRLAKERRTVGVVPALWAIMQDKNADTELRIEAINALGETATLKDLADMARLTRDAKNDNEKKSIIIALSAICSRMPQQASFDEILSIFSRGETPEVQFAMIDLLKTIGGKAAVDKVTEIALGTNPALADKATQVLGEWDSPDTMDEIAASLLKVAKNSREERFRIRGIRGYIRLARQFSYPEDKRIAMIRTAFDTATRPVDKKLIFEIFARYPSPKMLEAAVEYAKEREFREDAFTAAVAVGKKLQGRQPKAAEIMRNIITASTNEKTKTEAQSVRDRLSGIDEGVVIVKATYGAGEQQADVTEKVRQLSGGSTILDIGMYNSAFGDPASNVVKKLVITYRIKDGAEKTVEFAENASAVLPK